MSGVSGVTGAGPLFHDAMLAAARLYKEREFERPEGLVDVDICPLSGARPGPDCPHRRSELLPRETSLATCDMHERVRIDRRNGLRAGPACADASVDTRVFERYPPELAAWAENAGRPVAPRASSSFCPETERAVPSRLRIAFPPDGARFVRDGALAAEEAIRVRIDAPSEARAVRLLVDGRAVVLTPPFERSLPLVPGEHTLVVEADGVSSEPVRFSVQ